MSDEASILAGLRENGQEALADRVTALSGVARENLAREIEAVEWPRIAEWVRRYVLGKEVDSVPDTIEPAPYYPLAPENQEQTRLYERAGERGRDLLRNGEVAAFTVAGGQGTRLGFDGPKGTFPIAAISEKSLFQLFAETILRAQERFGSLLSWYIMTSPINDDQTRAFFAENEYFGLRTDQVAFFVQGTLPAVDFQGRALLAAPDHLALSPDGHGGSLAAMRHSGALDDMRERGIRHISYFQVDNPLVRFLDPLFIGLHDLTGSEMSSRSLTKTGAREKLGNFCLLDGTLGIVEYSDMPDELAEQTEPDGRLRFRAGSPAIHVLRRGFVERITEGGLKLPVHRAIKKVPHIDKTGALIQPEAPNAVKFETFVFDAIPLAANPLILEARRENQFGPVKNPTGVDSVESCRELLMERDARRLEHAGVTVPRDANGQLNCTLELSARRFLDDEDVRDQVNSLVPPAEHAAEVYS